MGGGWVLVFDGRKLAVVFPEEHNKETVNGR